MRVMPVILCQEGAILPGTGKAVAGLPRRPDSGIRRRNRRHLLHHGPRRTSAAALVRNRQVSIIYTDQVSAHVPHKVALLSFERSKTWISGACTTRGIELELRVGVNGPWRLPLTVVDHYQSSRPRVLPVQGGFGDDGD